MSGQSRRWCDTSRLLRRAGFGATGRQIDAVAGQDPSAYLDKVLALDPDSDPGAVATPRPSPVTPPTPRDGVRAAELAALERELGQQMHDLTAWWVRRMAAVEEPIHEKLTLLWHNHFATSALKVPIAEWMGNQNQKLRVLKLGDFRTMSLAMLTDAAMLYWLDGVSNSVGMANENLSREFMELFTLGHGNGYTENDVREGARALTGWFIGPGGQTGVVPSRYDSAAKSILGSTGTIDHRGFCDAVLARPESAAFVAGRFWRQLASDDAPSSETLSRLVAAYGPARDLKALTKAILLDPEFTTKTGTIVVSPVDWLVGTARTLKVPIDSPGLLDAVVVALTVMGQRPFYPPDVAGWPQGKAWLSTASTAARFWAADKFAASGDLSTVEDAAKGDRIDATGYFIGIGAWTDTSVTGLKDLVGEPRRLVAAAVNTPEYLTA